MGSMRNCRSECIFSSCKIIGGFVWAKKKKIGFTVACINEFAQHYNLSIQEAFRYLFQFKGIAFIKENYEVEHTLDFGTIVEDLWILCRKNGGALWDYITEVIL